MRIILSPFQSLHLLSHPEDVRVESADLPFKPRCERSSFTVPKKARSLKCVEERIRSWGQKSQPKWDTKYRTGHFCLPRSKTAKMETGNSQSDGEDDHDSVERVDAFSDVLITLRVYEPFKYDPYNKHNRFFMDYEIVVLGKQFLHEFRDMIKCPCDTVGPFMDISVDPSVDVRAADKYAGKTNSGFLFIGDTIYNDMRQEGNADYSREILAWAEKHPEVGDLKRGRMEEMQFMDLKGVRLGFPYVYQHFGACEHIFYFSDVRVISPADNRVRSDYPYLHLVKNMRNIVCDMCGIYEADHWVSGSSQHIFEPANLCAKCLASYHYVDGKKLGEFSAYRFR